MNIQSPEDIQKQIDEMNTRIQADSNRLARDLSFEISYWNSLNKGVSAEYEDHACTLTYLPEDGLCLQLCDFLLVRSCPCDNVSLDGELLTGMGRNGQTQWKIDDSLLKNFSILPPKNDVIINRCHVSQYNPSHESPLRTVLQFKGKNSPITFFHFFCSSDEHEVGVIVDSSGSTSFVVTGIRFTYVGKDYLLYSYADKSHESNYIVIETNAPVTWQAFLEVSRRILNVVGFFTGHFMFGPFLVFATKDKGESELVGYENSLPPPCESFYPMTGMNPYWYFASSDIDHSSSGGNGKSPPPEELREKLTPYKKRHVEKLMELLDDNDFSFLFYTLVENSMSQHMRMATSRLIAYATCLEIGGNWFRKKAALEGKRAKADFLPVKIRDELTSRLQGNVDEYMKGLESMNQTGVDGNIMDVPDKDAKTCLLDKLQIVRRRVKNDLFKQTNAEKLSSQFVENGITLTDSEVELLDGRNRILHGADAIKFPFEPENPEPYIEVSERKCFEYYALIWRLIMHMIGYDGVYRDVAGIQSSFRTHKSNNGAPFIRDV